MALQPIIYLDYNATTPVAPEVVNEMLPLFLTAYGNPSSGDHILGWQAKEVVEKARKNLAENLSVNASEIIFTAGATESVNFLLKGLRIKDKKHIVTVKTEHNAVLDTCKLLEMQGYLITYLNVDEEGLIDLKELEEAILPNTALVAIMWVNNETGVIQPMAEIAKLCSSRKLLLMSDATQAIGKLKVQPKNIGIDIILGSAHKIYGPKGVGFIYIDKKVQAIVESLLTGGGQEFKKRAGTLNVPSIAGFAEAVDIAVRCMQEDENRIEKLRTLFETKLSERLEIKLNGSRSRLYNTSNISFLGYDSERIMQSIGNKVAASRGSACSTGKIDPSHVLNAMGMSDEEAHSAIRFSFG